MTAGRDVPAMVLAAGFGTRMGALTADRPKPLIPVAGRTLIDRTLDHLAGAGIARAIVNLHYRGAMVRTHLAGRAAPRIAFSEEPELLDTGGGLVAARPLLAAPVAVAMNSDAVFAGPNPVAALLGHGLPERAGACLLMVRREHARGYTRPGDFRIEDGRLLRRGEAATAPLVYTGVQLLRLSALDGAPPGAFSMNRIWDRLLGEGRLASAVYEGLWVDVGTPDGIVAAETALAEAAP